MVDLAERAGAGDSWEMLIVFTIIISRITTFAVIDERNVTKVN